MEPAAKSIRRSDFEIGKIIFVVCNITENTTF